jgi:hypothetical protein
VAGRAGWAAPCTATGGRWPGCPTLARRGARTDVVGLCEAPRMALLRRAPRDDERRSQRGRCGGDGGGGGARACRRAPPVGGTPSGGLQSGRNSRGDEKGQKPWPMHRKFPPRRHPCRSALWNADAASQSLGTAAKRLRRARPTPHPHTLTKAAVAPKRCPPGRARARPPRSRPDHGPPRLRRDHRARCTRPRPGHGRSPRSSQSRRRARHRRSPCSGCGTACQASRRCVALRAGPGGMEPGAGRGEGGGGWGWRWRGCHRGGCQCPWRHACERTARAHPARPLALAARAQVAPARRAHRRFLWPSMESSTSRAVCLKLRRTWEARPAPNSEATGPPSRHGAAQRGRCTSSCGRRDIHGLLLRPVSPAGAQGREIVDAMRSPARRKRLRNAPKRPLFKLILQGRKYASLGWFCALEATRPDHSRALSVHGTGQAPQWRPGRHPPRQATPCWGRMLGETCSEFPPSMSLPPPPCDCGHRPEGHGVGCGLNRVWGRLNRPRWEPLPRCQGTRPQTTAPSERNLLRAQPYEPTSAAVAPAAAAAAPAAIAPTAATVAAAAAALAPAAADRPAPAAAAAAAAGRSRCWTKRRRGEE